MKRALLKLFRFYQTSVSPLFSAPVPLYPHLLGVCRGGGGEITAPPRAAFWPCAV